MTGCDEGPSGDHPSPIAPSLHVTTPDQPEAAPAGQALDQTAKGTSRLDTAETLDLTDPTPSRHTGSDFPAIAPRRASPTIPGYEIQGELGRGGMGVVYRARQVRLNRPCALKMILAGAHATPEAATRFLAEAEAIARLEHPHIVRIHHIGEADGLPFFELEFAPGGSLDRQLDGTPWPPSRAARLAARLASGVAEAHRMGIVHRDLKPGNVLLAADGTPKITDFGLAKALGSESGLTATEAILGSPSYMAPEQAGGKAKEAGLAADVYALGAILYELLTGRPPFRGATLLETLEQVKSVEPVPPSQLVPRLPRDVETICLKCLQKDPARRYESAAALAEDLRRFQAGESILARPVGRPERAWRWCRRNPVVAGLTGALLLIFVVAFAIVTWNYGRVESARRELEGVNYFQRIALAERELRADNLGRALALLDQCPERLRQWEWSYLSRLCRVEPRTFRDPGQAEVNVVAFSPDGLRLASAGGNGVVNVWDVETGAVTQALPTGAEFIYSVAFHPDGTHVASAGADGRVTVWDLATGRQVFAEAGYAGLNYLYGTAYGVAFSPDGRRLAAGKDGAVNLWDWRERRLLQSLPGHEKRAISVAFSPDGRRLATGGWGGNVMIWDAETGRRSHTLVGHRNPISSLAFSHDGSGLVSGSFDHRLIVWDASAGRPLNSFWGHDGLVMGVAFSPDGRRLASCGEDKTVRLWEAATGREVVGLRGHSDMSLCVAFSPDGRRLASCGRDGSIRLWDATPLRGDESRDVLTINPLYGEVWGMAVSPDGRRCASAGLVPPELSWASVNIWDLATGRVGLEYPGHPAIVFSVAWHPDGERVASSGWDEGRELFVVRVWDARSGRPAFTLPVGVESYAVAFSPNGRHLVTAGADRLVRVWDASTGREVGTLGSHAREVRGLAFSRDGRRMASASADGSVKLLDAARLAEAQEPGGVILTSSPALYVNPGFSPDGDRLVVGGAQNTVRIWDVTTCRELQSFSGHSGEVWVSSFSSDHDGRWIASGGEDSTVKVWDVGTGALLRSFRGHTGAVTRLAFTPDGRRLVSGSRDRTARVWDLSDLGANPPEP